MRKVSKMLITLTTLLVSLTLVVPALAAPPQPEVPQPIYRGDMIDINPVLEATTPKLIAEIEADMATNPDLYDLRLQQPTTYTVGDTLTWLALDTVYGGPIYGAFYADYVVRAITDNCEVWVQADLEYYNPDGTLNATHPDGKDSLAVTQERIDYLANTCNDLIHPTLVEYFGPYDPRDGTNGYEANFGVSELDGEGDNLVVLISNIRDDLYYDPINNTSFIGGFRWGLFEFVGDRNFISLDSRQWYDRLGDTGHNNAYGYDSTLAHELQHLIHGYRSPGSATWINEGLAEFSEWVVGYNLTGDLAGRTTWQTWPENSLVVWGDQNADNDPPNTAEILADYQHGGAFMLYTTGLIGGSYTDTAKLNEYSALGTLGYTNWLSDTSATNPDAVGLTFEDVVESFRQDMLHGGYTDDAQPTAEWNANFINEYVSPLGKPIPPQYLGLLRDNLDREGYDWPGAPPFGTDFIELCWTDAISGTATWPVVFDGDESVMPTSWETVAATEIYTPAGDVAGDVLYSTYVHGFDNFVIYGPITVGATDELSFDHYYDFEETFDFAFVQVTTDTVGGTDWVSLNLEGTITETAGNLAVVDANVPGFNGFSGGWITATYDIGADYDGEEILLAFRTSADGNTDGVADVSGWAIDNVMIGATTVTTGDLAGGRSIQEIRNMGNQFDVEFLTWADGDFMDVNNVYQLTLDPVTQYGTFDLATLVDTGFDEPGERGVFMVAGRPADYNEDLINGGVVVQYADYELLGLPPSICTSDVDAYGVTHAGPNSVYAGQVVTAAVHLDNLGSSPNITTTGPAMFYVGVEVPADTTYSTVTSGAMYTDDLSTVAGSFPAVPGVYWTGVVTRTDDFEAGFTTDADLVDDDTITVTVHYANDATAMPDQHSMAEDTVTIVNAFGLSALAADVDPVFPGTAAQFTASVINMSPVSKTIELVADYPADTTLVSAPTGAVTSTTQATVTQMIAPYAEAGITDLTFQWMLGSSYDFGDVVTSTMVLADVVTGETFDLDATADVDASNMVFLPVVLKGYTGTAVLP